MHFHLRIKVQCANCKVLLPICLENSNMKWMIEQVGPNVSISANERIGPGVRLIGCIILDGVEVKVRA